ncbi:hypothetical protein ACSQ5K_14710 [Pseudomonas sp. PhalM4]
MSQLFYEYKNCLLPRVGRVRPRLKSSFAVVAWPNGKPCSLVNFWLSDLSQKTTGQTIRQYCVNITPLLRYCYRKNIQFYDFADTNLAELSEELTLQFRLNGERQKQNNHVNAVIDAVISFFIWLRDVGNPRIFKNVIGEAGQAANISVAPVRSQFGRIGFEHIAHVPQSTDLHDKHAMPQSIISAIEDQIFLESDPEYYTGSAKHKFNSGSEKSRAFQKYLFERRSFSTWMFKRTGLRPKELCSMPWAANVDIIKSCILYIPTCKRRSEGLSLRPFKITADAALVVNHYLVSRSEYVQYLKDKSVYSEISDVMLLSEDGGNLLVGSLTRDFSRIVERAGLSEVRACLSMYRHRFITSEILLHLKEFFGSKSPAKESLSPPVIKISKSGLERKRGMVSVSQSGHISILLLI